MKFTTAGGAVVEVDEVELTRWREAVREVVMAKVIERVNEVIDGEEWVTEMFVEGVEVGTAARHVIDGMDG